jgi:hypothetical protein
VKSAAAISANYLQRVADPTSRFCADYFEYKKGRISSAQLVARLPHIAMIGDSLSLNVYVSSALSTLWRARRYYGNDWFLNADPSPESVYSVFERLDKLIPLVATEYGGLGAMVDNGKDRPNFFRKILRTRNFSGQVTQLLSCDRFPDLILIWIGHNNVIGRGDALPMNLSTRKDDCRGSANTSENTTLGKYDGSLHRPELSGIEWRSWFTVSSISNPFLKLAVSPKGFERRIQNCILIWEPIVNISFPCDRPIEAI